MQLRAGTKESVLYVLVPQAVMKNVIEVLKQLTWHSQPPAGAHHALYVDVVDGELKLWLHVWYAMSYRSVQLEDGDFDKPPEQLVYEILEICEADPQTKEASS